MRRQLSSHFCPGKVPLCTYCSVHVISFLPRHPAGIYPLECPFCRYCWMSMVHNGHKWYCQLMYNISFYLFLFRYMSIGDYAKLNMYKVKWKFESTPSVLCSKTEVRFTNFLHLLFLLLNLCITFC